MTAIERELAAVLHSAVDEPPMVVDFDRLARARRRRTRGHLAPIAACLTVLAVTAGVLAVSYGRADRSVVVHAAPSPGSSQDPHYLAAVAAADATLVRVAVLPRAIEVDHPPTASLDHAQTSLGSPDLIDRARWWTAPGTVGAAITYLQSRRPPELSTWSGSGSIPPGGPGRYVAFGAGSDTQVSLQFGVVPFGTGVAVRADAQIVWLASRPASEYIPAGVRSVDVTVVRTNPQLHRGAPTVTRTLRGPAAQRLADLVNTLQRAESGILFCPIILGGEALYDELVFRSAGASIRVVEYLAGCSGVTFSVGDIPQPALQAGLNPSILAALALSPTYGQ